jgi:hypothetical protein
VLAVSWLMAGCARNDPPAEARQARPSPSCTAAPGFMMTSELTCRVCATSHGYAVDRTFTVTKLVGSAVTVRSSSGEKAMPKLTETDDLVVLQVTNEDPGSVDTLSVDKRSGMFTRHWSGWTPQHGLQAGEEQGVCGKARPAVEQ